MRGMRAAPIAELVQLDLPFHLLLIFIRVIIPPFANGAAKGNEPVCALNFSHGDYDTTIFRERQMAGRGKRGVASPATGSSIRRTPAP